MSAFGEWRNRPPWPISDVPQLVSKVGLVDEFRGLGADAPCALAAANYLPLPKDPPNVCLEMIIRSRGAAQRLFCDGSIADDTRGKATRTHRTSSTDSATHPKRMEFAVRTGLRQGTGVSEPCTERATTASPGDSRGDSTERVAVGFTKPRERRKCD